MSQHHTKIYEGKAYPTPIQVKVLDTWIERTRQLYNDLNHILLTIHLSKYSSEAHLSGYPQLLDNSDLDDIASMFTDRFNNVPNNSSVVKSMLTYMKQQESHEHLQMIPRDILNNAIDTLCEAWVRFNKLRRSNKHHRYNKGHQRYIVGVPNYKRRQDPLTISMYGNKVKLIPDSPDTYRLPLIQPLKSSNTGIDALKIVVATGPIKGYLHKVSITRTVDKQYVVTIITNPLPIALHQD